MPTEFDQRDFNYTNTPEVPASGSSALIGPTYKIVARLLNRFTGLTGTSDYWTLPSMTVQGIINALPAAASATVAGLVELATPGEVQTGTDSSRAATPQGVRAGTNMLAKKADVAAATTVNITLSGTQTVDTVALSAGQRVLVKNQTTNTENGIYVVAVGTWLRAEDADESVDFQFGQEVRVRAGTQAGIWYLSGATAVTIGVTAIAYSTSTSSAAHAFWSTAHTDVDNTDTPADGEVPTYNSATSKWITSPANTDTTLIMGLRLTWNSATQITVGAGACYIPASGKVVSKATTTVINPTGLAANTWYYLYAFESGGTLAFEYLTTAPTTYFFPAKQSSVNTRRFIGSFKTMPASTSIAGFNDDGSWIYWVPSYSAQNIFDTPYIVINGIRSNTSTTYSAAAACPAGTTNVQAYTHTSLDDRAYVGQFGITTSASVHDWFVDVGWNTDVFPFVLGGDRQLVHRGLASATGFFWLSIAGWKRER